MGREWQPRPCSVVLCGKAKRFRQQGRTLCHGKLATFDFRDATLAQQGTESAQTVFALVIGFAAMVATLVFQLIGEYRRVRVR